MGCPCNGNCCENPKTHPLTASEDYDPDEEGSSWMDVYTTVCDNCGASCYCNW